MFDTIIKGGCIVDGSGRDAFHGDVAISDGKIVEVGKFSGAAREVIDAEGAIVAPGFVDPHSHYDGQFTWDDRLEPSFSHGVTTVIGGNCGVGFAPVRKSDHDVLIDLMDGVEDIPGIVLSEGLRWNWESFNDYMNVLGERAYTMDIGVQLAHAPLRVYAMGKRALDHEAATAEDVQVMAAHVRAAMKAGAMGFSAARVLGHRARSGFQVPGTFAADDELIALACAMAERGTGVFQIVPMGADGIGTTPEERAAEHDRFIRIARACGRPLTYLLLQVYNDPLSWRNFIEASERASEDGVQLFPQVATRPFGLLVSLDGTHHFMRRAPYRAIAHLPIEARVEEMRRPEVRAAILESADDESAPKEQFLPMREFMLAGLYAIEDPVDYEPDKSRSFGALAPAAGKTLEEYLYDYLVSKPRGGIAAFFALNYVNGDLDHIREMLQSPVSVAGLGDGGAHSRIICDASQTTYGLTFWARDRKRGPTLPLEMVVKKLTSDNARLYSLNDRGRIAAGLRADINVIAFDRLKLHEPRIEHDLPAGGPRMLQDASGYIATMVNGVVTRRHDAETGTRPGRLIRWH